MKKLIAAVSIILSLLYWAVPLGSLIASLTGYSFSLRNYSVSAIIMAVVSAIAVIIALSDKRRETLLLSRVLILLLLPISLINWIYFIVPSDWGWTVLCMAVCSACALVYMIKYLKHLASKIVLSVICALAFIPLCFLSFIDYMFNDFGVNTVVQTLSSPDGKYKAYVIDSDQGALGGNTFVDVCDVRSGIDLYILEISKKSQRVYSGDWEEYWDMEIYWLEDKALSINGATYSID